jgi:hypothetical protein
MNKIYGKELNELFTAIKVDGSKNIRQSHSITVKAESNIDMIEDKLRTYFSDLGYKTTVMRDGDQLTFMLM